MPLIEYMDDDARAAQSNIAQLKLNLKDINLPRIPLQGVTIHNRPTTLENLDYIDMHKFYECPHCNIVNVYVKGRS